MASSVSNINISCIVCSKKVRDCQCITCAVCTNSFHLKCAKVKHKEPDWYCTTCIQTLFPFNHINDDNEFLSTIIYFY